MRTDVKLGMVCALALVLTTGGYFMFRGGKQAPISLADGATKSPAATPDSQSRRAGTPPALGGSPLARGAAPGKESATPAKPPAAPAVRQPRTTVALGPNGQPATPPTSPVSSPNSPSVQPATPQVKPSEPPVAPTSTPGSAMPSSPAVSPSTPDRPAAPMSGREVGLTATNDPAKTAPSVPDSASGKGLTPLTSSPTPAVRPSSSPSNAGNSPTASSPTGNSPTSASSGIPAGGSTRSEASPASTPPAVERKADRGTESTRAAVDTHRVQPGDTLSSLAQTYYGDSKYAKILADANPDLGSPKTLRLGAVVKIPALPTDAEARAGGPSKTDKPAADAGARADDGKRYYTVKSGDSFYSIAKAQLGNATRWKELLSLNSKLVHGDPTSLQPGQKLVLPES